MTANASAYYRDLLILLRRTGGDRTAAARALWDSLDYRQIDRIAAECGVTYKWPTGWESGGREVPRPNWATLAVLYHGMNGDLSAVYTYCIYNGNFGPLHNWPNY